jgi:heme-degrading monooxygenase HmoA
MFEITTFRLAPEVDEAAFRAVDERVQVAVAYHQRGFLRRSLGRHRDGRWLVLTLWATPDDADAGRAALDASPLGARLLELIEPGSIVVDRFDGVD